MENKSPDDANKLKAMPSWQLDFALPKEENFSTNLTAPITVPLEPQVIEPEPDATPQSDSYTSTSEIKQQADWRTLLPLPSLLFCLVLLIIGVILWAIVKKEIPQKQDVVSYKLPLKWDQGSIQSIETKWHKTTNAIDGKVNLVPVTTLQVSANSPATFRIFHFDDKGISQGDPIIQTSDTATPHLEFKSTKGLESHSDFEAYRAGLTQPWKVQVQLKSSATSEFSTIYEGIISKQYN